ncbi:DUF1616 domain-containing protein [Saliphagus sp. LR7]|uniref:DUF1616 domain-containing protein n=1 Tax=Saliphagus sp. LR7 TaxID=2282654 RepID=UPI000DF7B5AF|nr:DUF1616 domain-containing protein [Saliphagus sp. LR7]
MVAPRTLWLALPRGLRELPADLAAAVALVVATNVAVLAPVIRETPLRVPIGLAFVLFVPGYAFVAALFPEEGESPVADGAGIEEEGDGGDASATWSRSARSGIDGIERVALSFGLSIAVVPLIGLVLNFTPWGIRLVPIMVAVSAFTLIAVAVGAHRRRELPADERFAVPYRAWIAAGRDEIARPDSRADAALNVLLAASILLAVASVGYAVMVPQTGEQFSAVYLLTETDEGELVADGYPEEFQRGESSEVIVGVDNHEHRTTNYTVVLVEQEVEVVENDTLGNETAGNGTVANATVNETVVRDQNELNRFETRLAHNESWHHPHEVEPTMTGEDVRLVWLLYPDEVPAELSTETTDYYVHLWVDVEPGSIEPGGGDDG